MYEKLKIIFYTRKQNRKDGQMGTVVTSAITKQKERTMLV